MKIKRLVLASSIFALAVGICSMGIMNATRSNKVEEASASRGTAFSGIYKKVTSSFGIGAGDKVLLVSENGDTIRDAGGNPGYLYSTRENVSVNYSDDYVYINNAYVVELTVYAGSVSNSFAFGGNYLMGWGSTEEKYGYIAYDIRGKNNSYPGPTDYQSAGIGYWKDATGLRNKVLDDSSWTISFSDGYINLNNVGGHGTLGFTYGYDSRFVLGGEYKVNLFKKVTPANMSITVQPTKSAANSYHYKRGEKLDFAGLEVDVTFNGISGPADSFYYDDDKAFFSHSEYPTGSGTVNAPVTFAGAISRNISIIVDQNDQNYIHVNSDLIDFRGNCILAAWYEDDGYHAMGFRNDNGQYEERTADVDERGVITITSSGRKNSAYFELVRFNGKYYLAKEVIENDETVMKFVSSNMTLQYAPNFASPLDVEYDAVNHCAFLKLAGTNNYLRFAGYLFEFSSNTDDRAQLYKQELTDEEYESVNTFVQGFHNATKVCVEDGNTLGIDTVIWNNQTSAFNALTSGAQGIIGSTTYTHNNETYGSINDVVDRYDYIISKYSQFGDFMNRKGNSSYENNYSAAKQQSLLVSYDSTALCVVIIAIGTISISSVAGLIISKKRKHE